MEEGLFRFEQKIREGDEAVGKDRGLKRDPENYFFEDKRKEAASNRKQPDIV